MSRKSSERRYASAMEAAEQRSDGRQPYLKLPKGVPLFEPKKGTMLLDIRPYEVGEGNPNAQPGEIYFARRIWVHPYVGADGQGHLCLRKVLKEPCPICEFREKLIQGDMEDEETEKLLKELRPRERQLFNVLNLKDPDKGIQVWDISYHLFGKVLDERILHSDEEDAYETFFYLEKGMSLKVGFNDKSFGGRTFLEATTIDFKDREDLDDKDLEESVNLDGILEPTPYDELKKLFHQSVSSDGKPKAKRDEPAPERRGRDERPERGEVREDREDRSYRGREREEREPAKGRDRERGPEREERRGRTTEREREPDPDRGGDGRERRGREEERPRVRSEEDVDNRRERRGREPEPEPERRRGREPEPETTSRRGREPEPAPAEDEWDKFEANVPKGGREREREPDPEPAREDRGRGRDRERESERPSRRGRD